MSGVTKGIGKLFGAGGSQQPAQIIQTPATPPPPPTPMPDMESQGALEAARKRRAAVVGGRESTILGSGARGGKLGG